jgi:hypothetical protein
VESEIHKKLEAPNVFLKASKFHWVEAQILATWPVDALVPHYSGLVQSKLHQDCTNLKMLNQDGHP